MPRPFIFRRHFTTDYFQHFTSFEWSSTAIRVRKFRLSLLWMILVFVNTIIYKRRLTYDDVSTYVVCNNLLLMRLEVFGLDFYDYTVQLIDMINLTLSSTRIV